MNINSIEYGISISPYLGIDAGFKPDQYKNHENFLRALNRAYYKKDTEYLHVENIHIICIEYREDWCYLYALSNGQWRSVAFTYGIRYVKDVKDLVYNVNSIEYAVEFSPYMGGGWGSVFYPHQHKNHKDFLDAIDRAYWDEDYQGLPENCPCGDICVEYVDGWSYLFQMDHYGNWDSKCFTFGLPKVESYLDLLKLKKESGAS